MNQQGFSPPVVLAIVILAKYDPDESESISFIQSLPHISDGEHSAMSVGLPGQLERSPCAISTNLPLYPGRN